MDTGTVIGAGITAIGSLATAVTVLWNTTQKDKEYARGRTDQLLQLTEKTTKALENNTQAVKTLADKISYIYSDKNGKRT